MLTRSLNKLTAATLALLLGVGSIATVTAADVATAAPAAAHTSGGNAVGGGQWHPWSSDGCSNVPNWQWGVFNFTHACQHHDGCYRNHWTSRAGCDRWFLNDMYASCRTGSTWWFNRITCWGIARTYYYGVRAFGWPAWAHWSWNIRIA